MAFDMLAAMGKRTAAASPSIVMIDLDNLVPNEKNFYRVAGDPEIEKQNEQLKTLIEMYGVKQPLIVKAKENGKYSITAGERRYLACRRLVEEGKAEYKKVPCIVEKPPSEEDEQIELIITNHHREKSLSEKIEEVRQLSELLQRKKERGEKVSGRLQDIIAEYLNMSKSEVGRLQQIDKNLQPELKEAIKKNELAMTPAVELSKLPAEDQKAVYEKSGGKVTAKEIKQYQEKEASGISEEMENMNIDGFEPMPINEYTYESGVYLDKHVEEVGLNIAKTIGKITVLIAYDPRDGKYRYGYRHLLKKDQSGGGTCPSEKDRPYTTKDEAFQAAINSMAYYNALREALVKAKYLEPLPEENIVSDELIKAARSMRTHLERELEKQRKALDVAQEKGNSNKEKEIKALIKYIGTSLLPKVQEDLFQMKGKNMFQK